MASRLLTDLDHRIQYEAGKVVEAWQVDVRDYLPVPVPGKSGSMNYTVNILKW